MLSHVFYRHFCLTLGCKRWPLSGGISRSLPFETCVFTGVLQTCSPYWRRLFFDNWCFHSGFIDIFCVTCAACFSRVGVFTRVLQAPFALHRGASAGHFQGVLHAACLSKVVFSQGFYRHFGLTCTVCFSTIGVFTRVLL